MSPFHGMPAAVCMAALLSSGCAMGRNGTTQRLHVNTVPVGAQVFVNGERADTTPTEVVVSRRDADPELGLQREGFEAEEIELRRGFSGWLWGDIAWSVLLAGVGWVSGQGETGPLGPGQVLFRGALGPLLLLVPTFATGAAYAFPDRMDVPLTPSGGLDDAMEAAGRQRRPMSFEVEEGFLTRFMAGRGPGDEARWRARARAMRFSRDRGRDPSAADPASEGAGDAGGSGATPSSPATHASDARIGVQPLCLPARTLRVSR